MTAFAERRISRALKNLQQPSGDPASSRTAVVGVEPALLKRGGIRLDPLSTTGNAMPQVILRIDAESSPTTGAWLKFRANARGVNQPTLLTKGDLPAQMADVRKRHPDDLLIVWAATDSAPPARLVEAGADIVITPTREASFSISMMKGRPIISLGAALADSGDAEPHAALWTPSIRSTDGPESRLELVFDVRVSEGRTTRSLTGKEIASLYSRAVKSSSLPGNILEHVDASASARLSTVTVSLTPRGRLTRNPVQTYPQAPVTWNSSTADSLEATPHHIISPRVMQYAMKDAGLDAKLLGKNFAIAEHEGAALGYYISSGPRSPYTAVRTVGDKHITRSLLSSVGLPVARGQYFASIDDAPAALDLMAELSSVVVKPVDGSQGRGVTVNVDTPEKFQDAWKSAFTVARTGVIVEKHFTGVEARFTVVDGTVVGVTRSRQPTIVGDGKRTVRELINDLNERRRSNPHLTNRPVEMNEQRISRMFEHGLHPLTVLPQDVEYTVGNSTGWYGGAETEDITDDVHTSYLDAAVKAVSTVPGLSVAGLDVLLEDYRAEATADNFIILEVNSQPGLGIHHFPVRGTARDVAGAIVRSDMAPRSTAAFRSPTPRGEHSSPAPTDPDPTTALFADALRELDFTVSWLATGLIHASSDGITTSFSRSFTSLTGKSGVIGSRDARTFARLIDRQEVGFAPSWKTFPRDADSASFTNGAKALAFAQTLTHPMIRAGSGILLPVDASDPESLAQSWARACRGTKRRIAVLDVDTTTFHRFLVAYDTVIAVLGPDGADQTSWFQGSIPEGLAAYGHSARRAVRALPGLDIAEVTMAIDDSSQSPDATNHFVPAVRPGLSLIRYVNQQPEEDESVISQIAKLHVAHLLTR